MSDDILPRKSMVRLVYRFLLGRPLDGRRRTDATFRRPGWKAVRENVYLSRRDYWAGWQVSLFRLGIVAAVIVIPMHALTHPVAFNREVSTATTLAKLAGVVGFVVIVRSWRVRRHIMRPLAEATASHLDYGIEVPLRRWVKVPRSLVMLPAPPPVAWARTKLTRWGSEREWGKVTSWCWRSYLASREAIVGPVASVRRSRAAVRITIPHSLGHVPTDTRKALLASSTAKLGGVWDADFRLKGANAVLILKPRPEPPSRVTFASFRERMENAKLNELALGLRAGYRTQLLDLENEYPHAMLSMGTGAGKSVLIRSIAAQAIHKGWAVILLDAKQDHYWCADLMKAGVPGVIYLRKIPDIHNALIKLDQIREWRSDVDYAHGGEMPMQRALILFEEMNMTVNGLRAYWSTIGKGKSPALTAFGGLSAAGRSAKMNLVGVGQYLTAQVFGGPEARENFGSRILARYTAASWKTLVPEYGPPPPRSSVRGRVQVCQGGGLPSETQVAFLSHDDVREYAMAGFAGVVPAGTVPFTWELPAHLPQLAPVETAEPLHAVKDDGGDPMRDLAGWIEAEVIPWSYDAAKKRRFREQRAGTCILPDRTVYTRAEVEAWVKAAQSARIVS
jgi:hypothetical protein